MMCTVFVLEDFAELANRAPALVEKTWGQDLFTCFLWFSNLHETVFARDKRALLYLAESASGDPLACLPLSVDTAKPRLGRVRRLVSLSNYYSSLFGPIVPGNAAVPRDAYRSIAHAIKCAQPPYDVVDMRPLDTAAPFYAMMRDALAENGFLVSDYFCFGNWYLPVRGQTFADYFASRPSALRNTVTRKERALRKTPGVSIVVEREPGASLDRAISDFCLVYGRSWKKPEPYPGFVPGLCQFLAREGWLRVGLVRVDQKPIAAQIFVVKDGRAMIYKLAYDAEHSALSPGSVLTKALFEDVFTVDRVTEIDYLTGDEAYKRDWMTARRERHGLIAFNRSTLPGLILAARHHAGRRARAILQRDPVTGGSWTARFPPCGVPMSEPA